MVEEKMVILVFTQACKMFLLSLDSEIVFLGDFRDQGINDFIMKLNETGQFRLQVLQPLDDTQRRRRKRRRRRRRKEMVVIPGVIYPIKGN